MPSISFLRQSRRLLWPRGMATAATDKKIKLVEVGPRDGLQNEKTMVPTELKVALVDRLSDAGLKHIEVSSFVNPKWVPQLADAADVFQQIKRKPGTHYSVLVPNAEGMRNALKVRPDEVAVFTSASEIFSKRNVNCFIEASIRRFSEVFDMAKAEQIPVRGYVSCVLGCPYEGHVSPSSVAKVVELLWQKGCYEISLGDTIGCGTPDTMDTLLSFLIDRAGSCPVEALAVHCHETGGRALDNILVALDKHNVRVVDSSVGGLGGCPYAGPGAPGNVATERVISYLTNKGYTFDASLESQKISEIGTWIREELAKLSTQKQSGHA